MEQLQKQKDDLESTILGIDAMLNNIGVGRHGALVDDDGFPLKDVDLYLVRTKRGELSCTTSLGSGALYAPLGLVNDHKALMKSIERLLPDALAAGIAATPSRQPFARVSRVTPGSLAYGAVGLAACAATLSV